MKPPVLHHLTLTVSDLTRSADFYQQLFGPAEVLTREGPGWQRRRLLWPDGLMIGVTVFEDSAGDAFDPSRIGVDHVGFGVDSAAAVRDWVQTMDQLGIEHEFKLAPGSGHSDYVEKEAFLRGLWRTAYQAAGG